MLPFVLVFVLLPAWAAVVAACQPKVSPARLQRFAAREELRVTRVNGVLVLRYLLSTRRWRTLGLWTGLGCGVGAGLRHSSLTLNLLTGLAGWFAGAVVAEWRFTAVPLSERRQALLVVRETSSYQSPWLHRTPVAITLAAAAVGLVSVQRWTGDRAQVLIPVGAGLALSCLCLVALAGAHRRVLLRSLPAGQDPELLAADAAVRRRSLRSLAGAATGLSGTLGSFQVAFSPVLAADVAQGCAAALCLTALVVGWWIGATSSPPPRGAAVATRASQVTA